MKDLNAVNDTKCSRKTIYRLFWIIRRYARSIGGEAYIIGPIKPKQPPFPNKKFKKILYYIYIICILI